jgi:hypothetical protein
MKRDSAADTGWFVLPAQTLRGSRQDMLATIDQAIMGLLALRHLVAGETLVMPRVNGSAQEEPDGRGNPTSLGRVGRIFSDLMRRRD